MHHPSKRGKRALTAAALASAAAVFAAAGIGHASPPGLSAVPNAQPKALGVSSPNVISPELALIERARGSMPLENGTASIPFYGYDGDGPMLPAAGDVPTPAHKVEATKTEPDKNTYLVLRHQTGADPSYDYGTHFLFQGHELGAGYITRVNLDADVAHRVTLMATTDAHGTPLPDFDGSTWDPWAQRLLFTAEAGNNGGVWQATSSVPSIVEDVSGALGRGGYEGVQNDSDGNVWLVEDVGGDSGTVNTHAKQPNSFVYRFVPDQPRDLTHGKLQVLAVNSLAHTGTIAFHAGQADADILSQDMKDLHTYGTSFSTRFVTIHDTSVDGTTPFDANALAKAAGATPFKRPENGQFRPGSHFREFYFDETGDTSVSTEAGSQYGGFGGIMKLTLERPGSNVGTLSPFYVGDVDHTGFDNTSFWDKNNIVFVEDRGDGLHAAHNAFDSAWMFDTRVDYGNLANAPFRLYAQGRDASATIDAGFGAAGFDSKKGFQNEGDNEITGFHVSDGDPSTNGLLGAQLPRLFHDGWRAFLTNQHGDNITDEIVADPAGRRTGDDEYGRH
jgi:hypothetical protein